MYVAVILITMIYALAAWALTRTLPARARLGARVACMAVYAASFPLVVWFPFYLSINFSRVIEYPLGFKDMIFFNRVNESRGLPVNRDYLIADREYERRDNTRPRVMILGDSFAAGYGLTYEQTLGQQLEKELGSGAQVINGAFFGTNTEMQVDYYEMHLMKYRPRVVVLRHRVDDVMPLSEKYYSWRTHMILETWGRFWPGALRQYVRGRCVLLIRDKYWRYYVRDTRHVIDKYQSRFLDRLNMLAAREGFAVFVIADRCPSPAEDVCRALEMSARKFGWGYYDTAGLLDPANPELTLPDGHPSAAANALLAQSVAPKVKTLLERDEP